MSLRKQKDFVKVCHIELQKNSVALLNVFVKRTKSVILTSSHVLFYSSVTISEPLMISLFIFMGFHCNASSLPRVAAGCLPLTAPS